MPAPPQDKKPDKSEKKSDKSAKKDKSDAAKSVEPMYSLVQPHEANFHHDGNLCDMFRFLGFGDVSKGYTIGVEGAPGNVGSERPEHLRRGVHDALAAFGVTSYEQLASAMPIIFSYERLGAAVPAGCLMDLLAVLGYSNKHTKSLTREVKKVLNRSDGNKWATEAERAEFHRKYGLTAIKGKSSPAPPKVYLKELPYFSGKNHDWALWKDNASSVLLLCGLYQIITDSDYADRHVMNSKMVYGMILEVFNKPSCEGDYLCDIDETGEMNGYTLWNRLETTYESPQVLKQVLKFKTRELTNLRCDKEDVFTTFVRDFMKLRKICDAYHHTIKKHGYKDVSWTLPTTDKEWKEQLVSKINIASLQNCRTRCEHDPSLTAIATVREFHGDLLEYNKDIRTAFEEKSTLRTRTPSKQGEEKPKSSTKKDNSSKDASNKAPKDNVRASIFGDLHKEIKGMSTEEQTACNKLLKQMKANGTERRRKNTTATKKRKRRQKAQTASPGSDSDEASGDSGKVRDDLYSIEG
jgi:hypothetical protein